MEKKTKNLTGTWRPKIKVSYFILGRHVPKKYAVTCAGYIKIHVEKDIIAIAYWYTRDISFPLFTSFVYDNLLFFLFLGKWYVKDKKNGIKICCYGTLLKLNKCA